MTKQILVETVRTEGIDNVEFNLITHDSEQGNVRTHNVRVGSLKDSANFILLYAKENHIDTITIDKHGVGLGIIEYLIEELSEDTYDLKTGKIKLSKNNLSPVDNQILITNSYKKALTSLNQAIKEMQKIQESNDFSSVEHRNALEFQVTLEKAKLELMHKESTNKTFIFGTTLNNSN